MMRWRYALIAAFAVLAACGQQTEPTTDEPAPATDTAEVGVAEQTPTAQLPAVDPALVAAPSSTFTAIEPSEVGVFGAPTVTEALQPLIGVTSHEGGATVQLTIREEAGATIADVVRTGIPDDSVSGGHIRVEFRQEPDGFFPTNAYRRVMCGRGPQTGQWTTELCP